MDSLPGLHLDNAVVAVVEAVGTVVVVLMKPVSAVAVAVGLVKAASEDWLPSAVASGDFVVATSNCSSVSPDHLVSPPSWTPRPRPASWRCLQ